jgi:hypothetical protein
MTWQCNSPTKRYKLGSKGRKPNDQLDRPKKNLRPNRESEMATRLLIALQIMITIMMLALCAPTKAGAQPLEDPNLVNRGTRDTLEAARSASPHSAETASAYFQDDVDAAVANALERVWDPTQAREPSPMTPWGDPDLRGYWLNVSYTPRQRPVELASKPLYSLQEAIDVFQNAVARDASDDPATVHYDWREYGMDNWQSPIRPNRRTSLIVDPDNGRYPPRTPVGLAQVEAGRLGMTLESRGLYERCITGNQGPPRLPIRQNTGQSKIVQTPTHVVLMTQANSEVRVFPLNKGLLHPPDNVRSWLGSSRGSWEGDTLVVETTNFHEDRATPNMHLVERFTRVAADTLLYEATVTDPSIWEAPWSVEVPWAVMDPPGLFESACHEQNYGIINVLMGVRARAAEQVD